MAGAMSLEYAMENLCGKDGPGQRKANEIIKEINHQIDAEFDGSNEVMFLFPKAEDQCVVDLILGEYIDLKWDARSISGSVEGTCRKIILSKPDPSDEESVTKDEEVAKE